MWLEEEQRGDRCPSRDINEVETEDGARHEDEAVAID